MPSLIPPTASPVWVQLATGQTQRKFSLFAANMAVASALRKAATDPSATNKLALELHEFFTRYEALVAANMATIA